jgi:hypothetical protein
MPLDALRFSIYSPHYPAFEGKKTKGWLPNNGFCLESRGYERCGILITIFILLDRDDPEGRDLDIIPLPPDTSPLPELSHIWL